MDRSDTRERIKKLYLHGYNAKQISKIMGKSLDSTRKYIQRNFKHIKVRHEQSVRTRKEALKVLDYEAKRYISDKSFIEKNRSIYQTKANGDIVINKSVAPVVTKDTPKRLNNEYKKCY